ncbi:sigma-70 family RNA polymerase sigma factor [Virgibacillus massiliensis]|nr:sigma-70 family RNA polymerase sigma factor [Virgibacillus massiliensis]
MNQELKTLRLIYRVSFKGGNKVNDFERSHTNYDQQDSVFYRTNQLDSTEEIESIMNNYGNEIKRLIYTYVKNKDDTDDITQEVFINIYRKLNTYKGKSSLKSWVYSIAINKSKDYLRSWRFRSEKLKDKLIKFNHSKSRSDEDPLDYAIKQDESDQLIDIILDLPIKYREIIILYYFKELTTKEIGFVLSVKEATVRTRLIRGREKLKNIMTGSGEY